MTLEAKDYDEHCEKIIKEKLIELLTYEEKVKRIYEAIADKALSFGCKIKHPSQKSDNLSDAVIINYEYTRDRGPDIITVGRGKRNIGRTSKFLAKKYFEIIGHPIHIGVVLDWIDKNTDGDKFSRLKGGRECNNYGRGASGNSYFDLTQQEEVKLATMLKRKNKTQPLPLNPTEERYPVIDFITSLLDQGTS